MVFGSIWEGGRSDLVIMERDPDSRGKGFTARSYQWALDEVLHPNYRPGTFFQQDNARIHTARTTQDWFLERGIWVIDWPAHSPDQNPIEHVWPKLKANLKKLLPNLHLLKDNEADRALFNEKIVEAWWMVPQAFIDNLIWSVPRRVEAMYRAKGWYTKY